MAKRYANAALVHQCCADMEFSRLESGSRYVWRPYFESLGLGLEHYSLGLGLDT